MQPGRITMELRMLRMVTMELRRVLLGQREIPIEQRWVIIE
jgi:hypothetical protein